MTRRYGKSNCVHAIRNNIRTAQNTLSTHILEGLVVVVAAPHRFFLSNFNLHHASSRSNNESNVAVGIDHLDLEASSSLNMAHYQHLNY
jgi:hypothetical protein